MIKSSEVLNVTAAVIERSGKILIAKRKMGLHLELKWEFPGGKVEEGETPEKCLERELLEEFGITTETREHIISSSHTYGGLNINLMAYHSRYISGNFILNDHEEIAWVYLDQLPDYTFCEADLPIISALKENSDDRY